MKYPQFRFTTAAIAATALALTAAMAGATQLDLTQFDYLFKVKFTGYAGSTTLTDFPVLVKINESNGSAFLYANCPDGADLRFADSTGELLPHEIDTWDPYGTSLVWVKVPTLNASTVITACYGYKGEDPLPAVTASDVWDNGYVAVWHLNADSTATTQADSTANALTLTEGPTQTQEYVTPAVAGVVGKCAQFGIHAESKGGYGCEDSSYHLTGFTAFTAELWSWQDSYDNGEMTQDRFYFRHIRSDWGQTAYQMKAHNPEGHSVANANYDNGTSVEIYDDSKTAPARETWGYHTFVLDGNTGVGKREIWLNGKVLKTRSDKFGTLIREDPLEGKTINFWLGNGQQWDSSAFPGKLDEVRISNVARSDDWVKATYDTVNSISFAQYEEAALANDWTKYKCNFTVSFKNYTGSTTLTDFPVLVKLSAGCFDGFSYADFKKPNGGDLRFSDEAGNLLPSEVDCWDTTGTSCVWVKVPSLNANTKIIGYYGWAPAPDVDSTQVWDSSYVAVWHLGADASSTTQADSTAGAFVLTEWPSANQAYVTPAVPGIVGNAAQFGIYSSYIGCYGADDPENKLTGFGAFTFEIWSWQNDHAPGANSSDYYYLHYCDYNDRNAQAYGLREQSGIGRTVAKTYYTDGSSGEIYGNDTTKVPKQAEWNFHAVAFDSTANTRRIFLNDEILKSTTGSTGTLTNNVGSLWVGNHHPWDGNAFRGKLDEVRISRVARSDDWIKATYDTIAGDLVTIGRTKSPTRIILR